MRSFGVCSICEVPSEIVKWVYDYKKKTTNKQCLTCKRVLNKKVRDAREAEKAKDE